MDKLWCIHTWEYYTEIEKKQLLPHSTGVVQQESRH